MVNKLQGWQGRILSTGAKLTLIKVFLIALPIYYFSLSAPTTATIKDMHRILANFFWNDNNGQHKCHWIKRTRICLPYEEGGLGIRHINDIVHTFSFKLWWRMRENTSLWAKYMMARYCSGHHPSSVPLINNSTCVWKRMLAVSYEVEHHLQCIVGRGDIVTCLDKWLSVRLNLLPEIIPVKSFFIFDSKVNVEYVSSLFGP